MKKSVPECQESINSIEKQQYSKISKIIALFDEEDDTHFLWKKLNIVFISCHSRWTLLFDRDLDENYLQSRELESKQKLFTDLKSGPLLLHAIFHNNNLSK